MTTATTTGWTIDVGEPVIDCASFPGGVAAGGSEGAVVVADIDGTVRLRVTPTDFLLALAASPDGTRLAVGGDEQVSVWDLTDGTCLVTHPARWCSALAWSAGSDRLAVGDGRTVRLLDHDGAPQWTSAPLPSTVAGLAFLRRDGRRVAAAAYQGVTILEPDTDRVIEHLEAPGAIAGLAVAPNGRWVVGGSQDATLHGWKVPGGDDFRMSGFPRTVSRLAFEPGGRWMACDGGDTVAFWDFSGSGPTGREGALGQGHQDAITALTWHPGEATRTLVTGDGAGKVISWTLGSNAAPGDQIQPTRTVETADAVGALAVVDGHVVAGHRSGALTRL